MASKGENETLINIDHDTHTLHVYSTKRAWWTRCEKLGMKVVGEFSDRSGRVVAMKFESPLAKVKGGIRKVGGRKKKP